MYITYCFKTLFYNHLVRTPAALRLIASKVLPCAFALALLGNAVAVSAQTYPVRPIRMVIQFPPGGAPDLIARTVGQKLTEAWGQQVIVDARTGAGGNIAVEFVARAAPDGYTLLVASPTLVINPSLYRKVSWDPMKDFVPISLVGTLPNMLVIHPSLPVRTVKEFITFARARPKQLNYSSAGTGTSTHLAGELFRVMAKVELVHVPYKGGAPGMTAVIAGEVPLTFGSASAVPLVKAGRLVALGMTTSKRWSGLPDVPTIAEAGVPGYEIVNWFGVLAPAATPPEIVARLDREIVRISNLPEVIKLLNSRSIDVAAEGGRAFGAYMQSEQKKWEGLIRETGVQAQ